MSLNNDIENLYHAWGGGYAHPDSPCGGGGPGAFRQSYPLGTRDISYSNLPHPSSPAGKQLLPQDITKSLSGEYVSENDISDEVDGLLNKLIANSNEIKSNDSLDAILDNVVIVKSSYMTDGKYHQTENNQKKFCFRFRVLIGSDLNYYLQGVIAQYYETGRESMYELIIGYKLGKYGQFPSFDAFWAADQGYNDYPPERLKQMVTRKMR